jgi:excisionase family DNA binding protein
MEFFTIRETAQLLKVSPITIRRYIDAGRLQAVRVGRSVRVRREAIEAFLTPVGPNRARSTVRRPVGRPLTPDDSLWNIVGIADSGPDGPHDVASNKHKYLADAYADLHEE